MADLNITNIPAPRVPFLDERTGLMSREWYRFFLNLFILTGGGSNPTTLEDLQVGPPGQPDLAALLVQVNQNIAPQYEDQSGDFLATLDTAQLMSMMARFEAAEAAIQGAYLQPVVQTGTIANYNLDGSPTAGGVAYGTGSALAVNAAGTSGQVLTSAAAGAPTWTTPTTGTVTSVAQTFTGGLITVAGSPITTSGTLALTVAGTSGGIPYFSSGTTWASSGALAANAIVIGGGAGAAPATTTTGTGVLTALGVNVGSAGAFVTFNGPGGTPSSMTATNLTGTATALNIGGNAATATTAATASAVAVGGITGLGTGVATALAVSVGSAGAFVTFNGALGTPSSGTVTNLTGTASININGTVGATTANTGAFTTLAASSTSAFTGNVGIGVAAATPKLNVQGSGTADVVNILTSGGGVMFYSGPANLTATSGESGTNAMLYVRKDNGTSRSINAAGTINASGADYAEYMTKAGDFTTAKGDVVGIDANGKLTNVFADAVTFAVKSTDPAYVGGDVWGSEDALGAKKPQPPAQREEEPDAEFASRQAEYEAARKGFDAALVAARQRVDRIAFCGQVPVNVWGATPGQYIIPVDDNGAIRGQAVSKVTFEQYQIAVGKVIAVLPDGRAKIIVKVA